MTTHIGALNQGTTSTRFIVFDRSGAVVSIAQREHEQIYPKAGWVEHDPHLASSRRGYYRSPSEKGGLRATELAAVEIGNQRETTIVWERRTGRPVMNAIVWQDVRVSSDVTELSKLGGPDRFRFYGLPVAMLTSPNFGQILGTIGTARQIQFALKFSF